MAPWRSWALRFVRPWWREIGLAVGFWPETIEGGGAVASLPALLRRLFQYAGRDHPPPEIALVEASRQDCLIGALQLGQGESRRHQVEGYVGVAQLRAQAKKGIVHDHPVGLGQAG